MTDALDDLYLDYLDSCDELGIDPLPVEDMVLLVKWIITGMVAGEATVH
jgi:hypothetical protein